MKIRAWWERGKPKGRTSGILQLNPQYPTNFFYHLSFSFFSLSLSLLTSHQLYPSMRGYSRIHRVSFFPIFFLFFCYPHCCLRQKSKSFLDSTDTPSSNSGFVNRFTWEHFFARYRINCIQVHLNGRLKLLETLACRLSQSPESSLFLSTQIALGI